MSKSISYACDVCGKEIIGHSAHAVAEQSAQIKIWAPSEYRAGSGQRIDLCLDCYQGLVNFLESGNTNIC